MVLKITIVLPSPSFPPQVSTRTSINYLHLDFINLILEKCIEIFGLIELLFSMSKLRKGTKKLFYDKVKPMLINTQV